MSSIADVRKCGRVRVGGLLPVVETAWGYRLHGLCRCHSVWVCPVCAPEIRAARGVEIGTAVELHLLGEGACSFGTGTLPHGLGDRLSASYSAVAESWQAVSRDRSVKGFRADHDWWGFVRTAEVTYGAHGWHPHCHWLDFWGRELESDELVEYRRTVARAWSAAVVRKGFGAPSDSHGVVLVPVRDGEAADYVTKIDPMGAGHELTSLSTKQARGSGLTPFGILGLIADEAGPPWPGLWWEYEKATRGRRMLGSSRRLLDRLGVLPEDPDPEAVGGEVVGHVYADQWDELRRIGGLYGAQAVIEAAAVGGQVGIQAAVQVLLGNVPVVPDDGQVAWQEEMF